MTEWMKNLPPELKKKPISELGIPGSHNSLCYDFDGTPGIGNDQSFSKKIKWTGCCCCVRKIMSNWGITQTMTINEQLHAGIRYLDLRIQMVETKGINNVHIVHGLLSPLQLIYYLHDIINFLEVYKSEVVIVNISHTYEMSEEDFEWVKDTFLKDATVCPTDVDLKEATLEELVTKDQRLILIRPTDFYAECIQNRWPNTNEIEKLLDIMKQEVRKNTCQQLKVVQGVITPKGKDILNNLCKSLKTAFGLPCRDAVNEWIQSLTPTEIKSVNVLIIDEVDKDFCRAVVALNAPGASTEHPLFHVIETEP